MRRKLGTKTKGERSEQLLSAAKAEGAGEMSTIVISQSAEDRDHAAARG